MASRERTSCSPMVKVSTPSILTTDEADGSTRRNSAAVRDDLPAPVLPTMPTRVLGSISKVMPWITGESVLGYCKVKFFTEIAPSEGQFGDGLRPCTMAGASWGTSLVYSRIRSTWCVFVRDK